MPQDLWGNDLTTEESQLLEVYERLRALARDAVTPCVVANVRTALAPVAVAVTDLGLRFEHLVDEGV